MIRPHAKSHIGEDRFQENDANGHPLLVDGVSPTSPTGRQRHVRSANGGSPPGVTSHVTLLVIIVAVNITAIMAVVIFCVRCTSFHPSHELPEKIKQSSRQNHTNISSSLLLSLLKGKGEREEVGRGFAAAF